MYFAVYEVDASHVQGTLLSSENYMCLGRQNVKKEDLNSWPQTVKEGCKGRSYCGLEPITLMRGWCREVWLSQH